MNEDKTGLSESQYDQLFDSVLQNLENDIPKVVINADEDFDALAYVALQGNQVEDVQIVPGEYPLQHQQEDELLEDDLFNSIVEVTPEASDEEDNDERQKVSPPKLKKKKIRLGKKSTISKKQLQFDKIPRVQPEIGMDCISIIRS